MPSVKLQRIDSRTTRVQNYRADTPIGSLFYQDGGLQRVVFTRGGPRLKGERITYERVND